MNDLINNTIQQITDIAGGFSGVETVIYRNSNLVRRSATGVETVISLDFTETDPTVPGHVKAITSTQVSNWNTAYSWGNHATAGYLTTAPTLAQVTTAGNTTTNAITVGGLTTSGNIVFSAYNRTIGSASYPASAIYTGELYSMLNIRSGGNTNGLSFYDNGGTLQMRIWGTGNVTINSATDAGYKFDVNGTARINSSLYLTDSAYTGSGRLYQSGNATFVISGGPAGESITFGPSNRIFINSGQTRFPSGSVQIASTLTLGNSGIATSTNMLWMTGSITAGSALGRGIGMDTTLVAAANNDVLVGLDINPTFTNGAFTGVTNYGIRTSSDVLFSGNFIVGTSSYTPNDGNNISYTVRSRTGIYVANTANNFGISYEGGRIYGNIGYGASNPILTPAINSWTSNVGLNALSLVGTNGLFTSGINKFVAPTGGTDLTIIFAGSISTSLVQGRVVAYGEAHAPKRGALEIYAGADTTYSNISFFTTGTEKLRIANTGNLLVGTTTDAGYKLDVAGTGRYTGTLTIQSTASDASPSNSILITTSSSGNGGRISWGDGNTSILRFSNSLYFREYTGNFVFENSSTGSIPFSVRPSGTTVAIGNFVTSASITAASALARGGYFNNTLVAAANNDTLVALDIQPVFNNGAFTGVKNYNIRTGGLITKQYFQSPTTNQGNHTIAFGFGGAGEQVKLIASAEGGSGRGNLYIATATGDAAVATTADANALFSTTGNIFYRGFTLDQGAMTTGNGLYLSGNQVNAITNGIYFRYSETRVAILSKPHGATGYADFRIAIVPLGSASPNNPPQESDTKFMITKDTTNVLINTTTDAGFKFDVNGTARTSQLHTFSQGTNLDALSTNYFYTADTGAGTYGGLSLKNSINNYNGIIYTGRSGANNTIVFEHTTYAGTATSNGSQKFGLTSTTFGVGANGTYGHTLTIHQRLGGAASYPLIITNLINTTNSGVGIIMQTADSTASGNINHASIVAFKQNLTAPNITSDLRFSTISDAANTLSEKMRISSTGNILIGTTTDAGYRLDVNGNARVQNSLYLSTSGSYLYADTNNIRLIDKNSRIILQSYPEGVASSETYLQSSSGSKFLRIREDYMGLEWCNSNVSNVAENPIRVVRGFFGNVTATNKSVLLVQSTSFSNLANATTLRGIYIDINDTTTYTGFATVRAIEAPRGGAYFNTTSPDASAVLQADSTTQGFLPPRMTTAQRLAITGPATSLIVFDTTADKLFIKTTAGWEMIQSVLETLT